MRIDQKIQVSATLANAGADLERLGRSSEVEIESAMQAFKKLATQADVVLRQAAAIVGRIEEESMTTVLASVQALCLTVRTFLQRRLEAATTILGTLSDEQKLLEQLTLVSHRQKTIARHLRGLSVLTNVEVAHLGTAGGNFQVLAAELSQFSNTISQRTLELTADTEERKQSVNETREELTEGLPRLRSDMLSMEEEIGATLGVIESSLSQQSEIPARFRKGAEETAEQIAGAVAAIQTHDITRQQIEHVQQSLRLMASRIASADESAGSKLPQVHAGLAIQIGQLKTIQETVVHWMSQIKNCMVGIQQLSASGVISIGPTVLRQERDLSSQLDRIKELQQKSQAYSERMHSTLQGLSSLVELVNEHLKQSQTIRDRLQFLMFNSMIEANHLGRQGAAVSAIANLIKGVSQEWNLITDQSRVALTSMLNLVKQTNEVMEVFSESSGQALREDQAKTSTTLAGIRDVAAFVAREALEMQAVTEKMRTGLVNVGNTGDQLDISFAYLGTALSQIESQVRSIEISEPDMWRQHNDDEVEQLFSPFYTTEIEREVMHATLRGTPLPSLQQLFGGNSVELF